MSDCEYYFQNTFSDYTPELAANLITDNKPSSNGLIVTKLKAKWDLMNENLHLNFNDYSVYTGTCGLALLKLLKNENLKEIKQLLSLKKLSKKRQTFLCGDSGPLAIGALITYKLNEKTEFQEIIHHLKSLYKDVLSLDADELLYGRVGYLYALLYVNKNTGQEIFDSEFIRTIIETIFYSGKNQAKAGSFKCPLMYEWHESFYLGAAHGLCGIIYLLLQAKEYLTRSELDELIKPSIDYLTTLRFPSGNFPSSLGRNKDSKVQWCHGAPGFVFLYCLAYKTFGDAKYLQLAIDCGDVVWNRGLLKKGYSLCHGVSGNAYCFLELYQTTQDNKHLYRAIKFAEWCINYTQGHEQYSPDRPFSLYEGIFGPMYMLLDIQNPMEAKFPGFTL